MKIYCLLVAFVWCLGSCGGKSDLQSNAAQANEARGAASAESIRIGYEIGAWWQSDMTTLVLAGDHIVVSHRDATPTVELIGAAANPRTRDEAKRKAWALYLELRAKPARFAEVAARESDEPLSAAHGGSLGVFTAASAPQGFVDAFGNIKEGEVSRPVETTLGYHVLRRRKPTAAVDLTLAHLVIKQTGAMGWRRSDRPVQRRTREEARELAKELAEAARKAPDTFGALALEHSDADDALRMGRIGTLNAYEVTDNDTPLLTIGAELAVGAISEPIELATGFHVLMRRPLAPRTSEAVTAITVGYLDSQLSNTGRPNGTRSREDARKRAETLAAQLRRHPEKFDELRPQYCDGVPCDGVFKFYRDRNMHALEREVAALAVGAISPRPFDTPIGFLIVRREDPAAHRIAPPEPTFFYPRGDLWGAANRSE